MRKSTPYILIILYLFLGTILPAKENGASQLILNFQDAWNLMETNNQLLQSIIINREAAIREIKSKGYLIPGIGLSSGLNRSSPFISYLTDTTNQDDSELDRWSIRGGIDIRLSLKTNLKIEDQINALKLNQIILQKKSQENKLRSDLQKLFFQISAGEKTILLQEKIANLSRSRLEQIEKQYNKGLASELDLLTAQISVARDQPTLKKARIDQEKRFITLRQYTGLDSDVLFQISSIKDLETKNEQGLNELLSMVMNNGEILGSRLQLELARKNLELNKKNLLSPSFGLSLGWSSSINPLFQADSWTKEEWSDSLGLGLSFSLPLDSRIKGSNGQKSLLKFEDTITLNEISLKGLIRKVEDGIRSLILDLELSNSNLKVKELNITLQEKIFNKVRQNYENGRTSLLDLDNSRQELQKALVALEAEILNHNLILIELNNIIN